MGGCCQEVCIYQEQMYGLKPKIKKCQEAKRGTKPVIILNSPRNFSNPNKANQKQCNKAPFPRPFDQLISKNNVPKNNHDHYDPPQEQVQRQQVFSHSIDSDKRLVEHLKKTQESELIDLKQKEELNFHQLKAEKERLKLIQAMQYEKTQGLSSIHFAGRSPRNVKKIIQIIQNQTSEISNEIDMKHRNIAQKEGIMQKLDQFGSKTHRRVISQANKDYQETKDKIRQLRGTNNQQRLTKYT